MGPVHQRDPLAVVSDVYQDFTSLLNTKRGSNETFQNFGSRFEAKVAKFNALGDGIKLPEALTAFMLLANSGVDNSQRISVLAASAPRDAALEATATTAEYLNAVDYRSIAAVLRQCDKGSSTGAADATPALSANAARNVGIDKKRGRGTLTPGQLADLRARSQCRKCHKWGHWAGAHNPDGSLKPGIPCNDGPIGAPAEDHASKPKEGSQRKHLSFNMARCPMQPNEFVIRKDFVGPLLDNAAPYSGMGLDEFRLLQPFLLPDWHGKLEPLPTQIADRPFWQYGTGNHSSQVRKILGSLMLEARSDSGNLFKIRHLVIEGASQWVVGRNFTNYCDILHIRKHAVQLPCDDPSLVDYVSYVDHDMHSYIPYKVFGPHATIEARPNENALFCATAQIDASTQSRPWTTTKKIIDKVHKHVCGHSSFTDMKVLLERNDLWDDSAHEYLSNVMQRCQKCRKTAPPKEERKVSLSTITRAFNSVVCVDHVFLGDTAVFHIMDSSSRYSAGMVVPNTSMSHAVSALETVWINPFWTPEAVVYDRAFKNSEFEEYLQQIGASGRPIPARRHNKNVLESKHKILRNIYLRLKDQVDVDSASKISTCSDCVLVQRTFRVSNDLYGSDTMSAHELAKGYTRPIGITAHPTYLPSELREAHDKLIAKRKLTLILRSKSIIEPEISTGDMVEVFIKKQHEKRGSWTAPKLVLSYDHPSRTVTVPGARGKTIAAAVEDVRHAVLENDIATAIQDAIDSLDCSLDIAISGTAPSSNDTEPDDDQDSGTNACNDHDGDAPASGEENFDLSTPSVLSKPEVGDHIEVYWPLDDKYYGGKVAGYNNDTDKHDVTYDDGEKECLNLSTEQWRFANTSDEDALANNDIELAPGSELTSIEAEAVDRYFQVFGNKDFMLHQAQGLPPFVTQNAYMAEEESFLKTVRHVNLEEIPQGANIISSHVLYKVKDRDDGTRIIKARIAPHGNKDADKDGLKTDSTSCPPIGIRALLSLAVLKKWTLAKIDFKSAFLQTGEATRDVYVVPPRECSTRSKTVWLLLTAAYGLVNAGAKWQAHSDQFLHSLGLSQLPYIPQLFYMKEMDETVMVAVKVVDDILFASELPRLRRIVSAIQGSYTLGTVVYSPGTFKFFGITIHHADDFTIQIHANDKLTACEAYPISRARRKDQTDLLDALERKAYRSLNSSLGWIGVGLSPFCAHAASYLQQKGANPTVADLVTQINMLRLLKKYGTSITFQRPSAKGNYPVSLVTFADASRPSDHGQLGTISGLLIGDLKRGSVFHTLSWSSRKSTRPVKSIASAETLAVGEGIDEGKLLRKAMERLLHTDVDLSIVLDSKDLFETLSTCRNATDRSIRADVNVIRFEFETRAVSKMIWTPGKTNLADPLTKPTSPLCQALSVLLVEGKVPIDLTDSKLRSSTQSTG